MKLLCLPPQTVLLLNSFQVLISTGVIRTAIPMIVSMDVAAAEPNNCTSSPRRSLNMIHDKDVALAEALNPTIGSKT
ncbi:uncharacterized protein METZ01_LOCUS274284, partial [marine metagenome]